MPALSRSELQLGVLESLESAERYNAWLADLTLPFLGEDPVEIGSGIGVTASTWLAAGLPRITVSDLDPACLRELRERFGADPRVEVARIDLDSPPLRQHSAVVALNVLEHIEEDVRAIRHASRLLRPGGRIVLFVPAFPFATGRFDREIGHHRRYTLDSIGRAFTDAGGRLVSARYVNAPGLLAWFAYVRLLRGTPGDGPLLRAWDRAAIPVVRRLESRWSPPFGQSVLAVGAVDAP
jgi:SAM-dependent methyltransferase